VFDSQYAVFSKKVKGFQPNLFGRARYENVSLES
jgi:hypothetical protein